MEIKCAFGEVSPLHKLQPHPKNPNEHPEAQIDLLAKIIDYQGIRHPIVVSRRSGFIVAGHGRLLAAKKLEYDSFPVDFQDFESEAQEYAFVVSDNSLAELSALNRKQIGEDILDFGPDFDLELMGIPDFVIDPSEAAFPELDENEPQIQQMTFTVSAEQKQTIDEAIKKAKAQSPCEDEINENKNGNALYYVATKFCVS